MIAERLAEAAHEPPADLIDAIYDDLVQVRLDDAIPGALAQWLGARELRLLVDGNQPVDGEGSAIMLRSAHDGVARGWLEVASPPGSPPDPERLQVVCDHIATALAYREKLLGTRRMYEVFSEGLDRLSIAVMTVRESGHPIDANRAAQQILERRDGLSLISGKLCAAHAADQKAMRQRIDAVFTGEIAPGGMQLQRPSGEPDFQLLVMRPPALDGGIRIGLRILLRDPSAPAVHSRGALMDLYGLTEAEAAVTLQLANGDAPEDVEEQLSIRHNTMRAHLRAIYAKLGVGSHAELIYAVLSGAGTLALANQG